MLTAIVTTYVVSLVLFTPMFLHFTARWTVDPSTNTTIAVLSTRDHPFHPDVPRRILAIVTGVLLPTDLFVVIVSSVLVVVKLGAARRLRKQMSNSQSERNSGQSEAKITQMLLSICILFIILMVPETAGTLLTYFIPELGPAGCFRNTFNVFFRIVSVLSCLNSSVNFIAYVSLSAKFRTTLLQILHCCAKRKDEASTSKQDPSSMSVTAVTSMSLHAPRSHPD